MSFINAVIRLSGLLWFTMLCTAGEIAEWPDQVLAVDGTVVISGAQLRDKLNELKVEPEALRRTAEQLVLNAARDAVVVNCLKKAGIIPSEGLALEVQKLDFERMSGGIPMERRFAPTDIEHARAFQSTTLSVQRRFSAPEAKEALIKLRGSECGRVLRAKGRLNGADGRGLSVNMTPSMIGVESCAEGEPCLNIIGERLNRRKISSLFSV